MNRTRIKLLAGGLVLSLAVGYLAFAGMKKGWVYHLPVDQFVNDKQYHDQRVRVCGRVSANELAVNPGRLTASFTLLGDTQKLPVVYRGTIPDTFKVDAEVVVEGRVDPQGVFQAEVLMTKCASKTMAEHKNKPS